VWKASAFDIMGKILIVFYSTYGHVYTMAKAVKEGVDKVDGCEGVLYQVTPRSAARLSFYGR
jgi:NAD(P)H dehydrogenase (quinone)